MVNPSLPPAVAALAKAELNAGERVRWSDQPIPALYARRSLALALFGIPFTAFSVFWMAAASGFKAPELSRGGFSFFPLFGLPFLLVGASLLLSPLWMRLAARRTAYVLTDRRAIVFSAKLLGATSVRSFEPSSLKDLERIQRTDGSGDLVFERIQQRDSDGNTRTTDVGFLAIADVKKVETLVKQLVDAASRSERVGTP